MRYNLDSTLPINAFSPRGSGPFSYGMTLEGGNPIESVVNAVSDAGQSVANVVSDVGVAIDNAVIQPAVDDPVNTAIKLGAYYVGGPLGAAAASGGISLAQGNDIEDAAKAAAVSYVAGQVGGEVGGAVAGETGSQFAGNLAQGGASGTTSAVLSGRDPVTGLLSGVTNAGINAGVGAAVDTGAGLFNGTTGSTNTGTTGMDELFGPTYNELGYSPSVGPTYSELGYDPFANLNMGDVEAQQGGYYGGAAPDNPYINMSDAELTSVLANTPSFISSGGDSNTALNLVKSLGSQAVKALLGGGGTAAQRAALGLGQNTGLGSLLGGAAGVALTAQQRAAIQNAYNAQSQKVSTAATQAQNLASFTPIGTTNFFGSSQFTRDPVTGQITSAGYTPTAQVGGQIQNLFGLGAEALPTTTNPQALQQQYITQQQGLLAPGREQQLAQLENRQYQTGTTGLATGGTMAGYTPNAQGLMATNPGMAAYYNAIAEQDARLAANAPTYAQSVLDKQIATGTGLFGSANVLQGYAQQPFAMSTDLAKAQAAAGASAGQLGLTGQTNAAQLAATGALQGNAAMQGTYNQLGQVATGLGNQVGGMLLQNPTIANWLS